MNLELISTYLINNQTDAAYSLLQKLPVNITQTENGQKTSVLVDFYRAKQQAPDLQEANNALLKNSNDHSARYYIGVHKLLEGSQQAALEDFLYILENSPEYEDGLGQKALIAAFALIEDESLIKRFRRKMASLLH